MAKQQPRKKTAPEPEPKKLNIPPRLDRQGSQKALFDYCYLYLLDPKHREDLVTLRRTLHSRFPAGRRDLVDDILRKAYLESRQPPGGSNWSAAQLFDLALGVYVNVIEASYTQGLFTEDEHGRIQSTAKEAIQAADRIREIGIGEARSFDGDEFILLDDDEGGGNEAKG